MAQPAIIYRIDLQLSDLDRNRYESLQATVARHPSETEERLVARILAYALCYDDGLVFTRGISSGDEPDLWVKGPDGRVACWIEVGLPDPDRLVKASRHCGRVILFACGSSLPRWTAQHLAKLSGAANVTVVTFDQQFLDRLTEGLQRSIAWSLTITENSLYLGTGHSTLETSLAHLCGPAL